ncbi:hypothetical protein BGW41_005365 [Actinomortierella wolfii]|nr:hypothetical protein BGW41_005365 [Actinomortierella wolfii]
MRTTNPRHQRKKIEMTPLNLPKLLVAALTVLHLSSSAPITQSPLDADPPVLPAMSSPDEPSLTKQGLVLSNPYPLGTGGPVRLAIDDLYDLMVKPSALYGQPYNLGDGPAFLSMDNPHHGFVIARDHKAPGGGCQYATSQVRMADQGEGTRMVIGLRRPEKKRKHHHTKLELLSRIRQELVSRVKLELVHRIKLGLLNRFKFGHMDKGKPGLVSNVVPKPHNETVIAVKNSNITNITSNNNNISINNKNTTTNNNKFNASGNNGKKVDEQIKKQPLVEGYPYACGELFWKRERLTYGRYTADIRTPQPQTVGHVTGFYLRSRGGETELDVELTGLYPSRVWFNIWQGTKQNPKPYDLPFNTSASWHNYGIEWRPTWVAFFVDGKVVLNRTDVPTTPPEQANYRLAFNAWPQLVRDATWAGEFSWPSDNREPEAHFRNFRYVP